MHTITITKVIIVKLKQHYHIARPNLLRRKGLLKPTVLEFIDSLTRFLAILVGDKPLIIFITKMNALAVQNPCHKCDWETGTIRK